MPDESEVASLLALCLLQHSRRHARRDSNGDLVTLDRQDRSKWDRAAVAEGLEILLRTPVEGPYALQARIAACHASGTETDWVSIAGWYDELARVQPSPVVELNRAVAHGYAFGPTEGLALLAAARSGGALDGYPAAIAVEGDLTLRSGDAARASELFRAAAAAAPSEVERRALLTRAAEAER
jgi:RNA polymerase sigma-70 factor (ECF subfamily)